MDTFKIIYCFLIFQTTTSTYELQITQNIKEATILKIFRRNVTIYGDSGYYGCAYSCPAVVRSPSVNDIYTSKRQATSLYHIFYVYVTCKNKFFLLKKMNYKAL